MSRRDPLLSAEVVLAKLRRRYRGNRGAAWLTGHVFIGMLFAATSLGGLNAANTTAPAGSKPLTAAAVLSPTPAKAAPAPESGELVITVLKRQKPGGKDVPVGRATVRLVGSEDAGGEETDGSGTARLSMPRKKTKVDLQVMVAGERTCVVKNVPLRGDRAKLTVLIESKDNICTGRVVGN